MSTTNGKICYVELPAIDVARSAAFYATAFGWKMRRRGDGQTAFDDSTGAVSGAFVLDRAAAGPPGLLVYIMVDSAAEALEMVLANGGEMRNGPADWCGRAGDYGAVSGSGGECVEVVS